MPLHPHFELRWRTLAGWALAAGLCSMTPLELAAQGGAQERVLERYRQMLKANPVEGTALDRLWKSAEAKRETQALLEEYGAQADQGEFSGLMIHGLLLRRAGDEEAAQKRFRQAAEKQPDSPLPYLALAENAEGATRAEALQKASELLPADSPLLPGLLQKTGEAWIALAQPDRAGAAWDRMVALDPHNIELRQRLAEAYITANAPEQAAPHYDYLEKHGDPATRAGALRSLARLRQGAGQTEEALSLLERAMALTSADNWLRGDLIAEMIRYSQQANTVEALEKRWKTAAAAAPKEVAGWQKLAALYHQEGEPAKEQEALEQLVALQPQNAELKRTLARLLVKLDLPKTAAPLYDELIAAQPAHRSDPDLIFERATLEVRLGQPEAARERLEALAKAGASPEERKELAERTLAFYHEHRMLDALEAALSQPGSDPVALALFLFQAKRSDEARAALKRLAGMPDELALREDAAERLKQAGEHEAALAQREAAARLQPESREAQMALGELAITLAPKHRQTAVTAFTRAVELSPEGPLRLAADQMLFRAYEGLPTKPGKAPSRPISSAAEKAMEALLSAPASSPETPPDPGEAQAQFILKLEEMANADASNPALWLRLARWNFWKREFTPARAAMEKAAALRPTDRETLELGVAIAQNSGDPTEAVQWLTKLIAAYPKEAAGWQKQIAMLRLQNGEAEEGLKLLEELAASGDPAALADLARGQQQADRWYDALETWQRAYGDAKSSRKYDVLQPLVRVMQHLEMHPRAAQTLWEAYEAQPDPALRGAILADLIAQCKNRGTLPWLLEKLAARAQKPGEPADQLAWASALKADGRGAQAYDVLKSQSVGSLDRAVTEAELSREAEELGDYVQAAAHQKQRLLFLSSPDAAEWERLATLQEAALDYEGADESYRSLAKRFPRNTPTLLKTAAYFEKWGNNEEAAKIDRSILSFDPMALAAAAGVVRLSSDPAHAAEAARLLLTHSKPPAQGPLVLPEISPMLGNKVRALLQVISNSHGGASGGPSPARGGGVVTVFNERGTGTTEAEWRLEAIRCLARQVSDKERAAWTRRWREDKEATNAEVIWALYYARADRDLMAYLISASDAEPGEISRRLAVMWMGLSAEAWPELGKWLWSAVHPPADYDHFRTLLGEWAQLGHPLDAQALFRKAPVARIWSIAEELAAKERVDDAAAIGRRLLDELPTPVMQLGADQCLKLSQWLLLKGDTDTAETLLRKLAMTPGDSLEAPAFAAQRALYRMLPPLQRKAWMNEVLSRKESVIHAAYSEALLRSLDGQTDAARHAIERLVRLGSGTLTEASATERSWNALLRAGIQLAQWNLPDAAVMLWEGALADHASMRLQGERVTVYTAEISRRLAALKLAQAELHEVPVLLDGMIVQFNMAELQQIAAQLASEGFHMAAAQVSEAMSRKEPRMPLHQLVKAYDLVGDEATLRAMVEEWCARPQHDPISAPVMIETLARWDRSKAKQMAAKISSDGGLHPALFLLLGQWQIEDKEWKEAAATLQQLLRQEPHHPTAPVLLATVQVELGFTDEAMTLLRTATNRTPALDLKRLELALKFDDLAQARQIAAEFFRASSMGSIGDAGALFVKAGKWREGAELLSVAVDNAEQGGKPRTAFEVQRGLILQLARHFPKETGQRWMRRLIRLSKGWPELMSATVEIGRDSRIVSMREQVDWLSGQWANGEGEPVAGAWLLSHLLDTTIPADDVLKQILARSEFPSPLLVWLRERCEASKRPEFCLQIDRELLRRRPGQFDDLIASARTLHSLHRSAEAITLMESALPWLVFADDREAGKLGLLAYDLGEAALARRLLEQAIHADTAAHDGAVYVGYARLLMTDGDFPAAKRTLRQAFRNPAMHDAAVIVDYLRRSGRMSPESLPSELLDLNLRPAVKAEVEKLLQS